MNVPPGHTEETVLAAIERCVGRLKDLPCLSALADYDADDVAQEIRMFAIQVLTHYRGDPPLDDYLARSVRNRLIAVAHGRYCRARRLGGAYL